MAANKHSVGDTVYEVFLYKVRKARVTSVKRVRLDNPTRSRVYIYTIRCDDASISPRYYESDFGKVLFTDIESARAQLAENIRFRSRLGGREQYETEKAGRKIIQCPCQGARAIAV